MQKEQSGIRYYTIAALVCGLAALFYLYEFTIRTMPSAMTSELMRDFNMSAAGLGVLSSMFYWGYTFMQIPAGLLFDRYGERVLVISVALCSLGTLLFGLTTQKYLADAAFLLIGFASSTAFVGALVLIIRRFPPKYFAMLVGLVQFLGCLGAIVGIGPVVALVRVLGWQSTVEWFALFGFILTVLMFFFIHNSHKPIPHASLTKSLPLSQFQRLKIVCRNPQTWWVGMYAFAIWGPVIVFAGLFGLSFLEARYRISPELAAQGIMIFWLGIAIGGPIVGWLSNFIDSRKKPLIFCGVLALLSTGGVIYLDQLSFTMSCVLLFFAGAAASGQALSFGVVHDIHPRNVIGTGSGFNNMAVIIGGLFLQPIAGAILAQCTIGKMVDGAPVYHLDDYRWALLCVPICSVIAILTAAFAIRETGCRSITNDEIVEKNHIRGEVVA